MNYPIYDAIMVDTCHYITYLSESIEHRTPRAHPSVNCEHQVIVTYRCELIFVNRGSTLEWGVLVTGEAVRVSGQGEYGKSILCAQFYNYLL